MPRVLLVDDDPEAIEWLSELIRSEGYTVAAVDSLKAARIHLTRSTPELILTDLMLPDGQGIELLADFGSRPAPAIVVVTGYASIESAIEAMRPNLKRDRGDVELVEIDGKNIYVNMTGACAGCQMASTTIEGIQQRIVEDLGEFVRVLPASAMRARA